MDTNTLLEILSTRIEANDNNPTKGSLLYELVNALKRLKEYEITTIYQSILITER